MSEIAVASNATSAHPPLLSLVKEPDRLKSVELFAGAGGLALGCEIAGFGSVATLERDRWACDTVRENKAAGSPPGASAGTSTRVTSGTLTGRSCPRSVDLVAGGPPCQPFSAGGRGQCGRRPRDMFPATAEIIAR